VACYLSIDTEATGLTLECQLIQLAFVPVDTQQKKVMKELGAETLVKCPSFKTLKPTLNAWVVENMGPLIDKAHNEGIEPKALPIWVDEYFRKPEIKKLFGDERVVILGKSLSALDIPLLHRTLGETYMHKRFHHHTLDVTCAARFLVDKGLLPKGCESSSKLIKHFGLRSNMTHTALNDAVDMGEIYLKLLEVKST